jgi:hypothetical protein
MSNTVEHKKKQLDDLTPFVFRVFEFIKNSDELLTTDVPSKIMGAVPHLISKGLIEVYKKPISFSTNKKRKFLKVKTNS